MNFFPPSFLARPPGFSFYLLLFAFDSPYYPFAFSAPGGQDPVNDANLRRDHRIISLFFSTEDFESPQRTLLVPSPIKGQDWYPPIFFSFGFLIRKLKGMG